MENGYYAEYLDEQKIIRIKTHTGFATISTTEIAAVQFIEEYYLFSMYYLRIQLKNGNIIKTNTHDNKEMIISVMKSIEQRINKGE